MGLIFLRVFIFSSFLLNTTYTYIYIYTGLMRKRTDGKRYQNHKNSTALSIYIIFSRWLGWFIKISFAIHNLLRIVATASFHHSNHPIKNYNILAQSSTVAILFSHWHHSGSRGVILQVQLYLHQNYFSSSQLILCDRLCGPL